MFVFMVCVYNRVLCNEGVLSHNMIPWTHFRGKIWKTSKIKKNKKKTATTNWHQEWMTKKLFYKNNIVIWSCSCNFIEASIMFNSLNWITFVFYFFQQCALSFLYYCAYLYFYSFHSHFTGFDCCILYNDSQ